MKLGICTGPENMQLAAELGYDYIEWALNAIAAMPQERFEALREQAPNFPVPRRLRPQLAYCSISPLAGRKPRARYTEAPSRR